MKVFNKISFFQDLQNKITLTHIRHLIKEFKYEFKESGDVVFQYGEFGSNYYILLKGSLFLLLPKSTLNVDYNTEKHFIATPYLTEPMASPISNVMKNSHQNNNQNLEEKKGSPTFDSKQRGETPKSAKIDSKTRVDTPKMLETNRNSHVSPSQKGKFTEEVMKRKMLTEQNMWKDDQDLMMIIRQTFTDFEITKKLEAVTGFGEIALMSNLKRFDKLYKIFIFDEFHKNRYHRL